MAIREGSWGIESQSDPRWNKSGRAMVGGFGGYETVYEAKDWVEKCKKEFGEIPKDLTWEYMKD